MLASVVVFDRVSLAKEQFFYLVPERLKKILEVGSLVSVPFGTKQKQGMIVAFIPMEVWKSLIGQRGPGKEIKLREINELIEDAYVSNDTGDSNKRGSGKLIPDHLVQLAFWLADYYHCSLYKALKTIVPKEALADEHKELVRRFASCKLKGKQFASAVVELERSPAQRRLLIWAEANLSSTYKDEKEILAAVGVGKPALDALIAKGYLTVREEKLARQSVASHNKEEKIIRLNKSQHDAIGCIVGKKKKHLLFGVTGSGKTEVYLQAAKILTSGNDRPYNGQVVMLVPEIALTPQLISRCRSVLGDDIAVWHSHLSAGERREVWRRVWLGSVRAVIGSRSAVFLPVPNLRAIFIDEEHEWSYKQDQSPRYHTREVAEKLSELTGCRLILGSATPSMETFYRAGRGELALSRLPNRVGKALLPTVEIIDLGSAERVDDMFFMSKRLADALAERLKKGEQSILFLNRRGSASAMVCEDCGKTLFCSDCDVALTLHCYSYKGKRHEYLMCHYCGKRQEVPTRCLYCKSLRLSSIGVGTQRVADELSKLFPNAKIARIDSDSLSKKDNPKLLFEKFRKKEADIIIGTQVIAKGWDLPSVSLIGVILADIGLHIPDFRASERVFQLLTQVSGRAGRGKIPGEVIIQTLSLGNTTVEKAAAQDFEAFYTEELGHRRAHKYPPFGKLLKLTYVDPNYTKAKTEADILASRLREQADAFNIEVLGPAPAMIQRKAGKYHMQILLKGLRQDKKQGSEFSQILANIGRGWRIDVDPLDVA